MNIEFHRVVNVWEGNSQNFLVLSIFPYTQLKVHCCHCDDYSRLPLSL